MNLKKAKHLRNLVKFLYPNLSEQTLHIFSKKRGQSNCVIVSQLCQREKYLLAKKEGKVR